MYMHTHKLAEQINKTGHEPRMCLLIRNLLERIKNA